MYIEVYIPHYWSKSYIQPTVRIIMSVPCEGTTNTYKPSSDISTHTHTPLFGPAPTITDTRTHINEHTRTHLVVNTLGSSEIFREEKKYCKRERERERNKRGQHITADLLLYSAEKSAPIIRLVFLHFFSSSFFLSLFLFSYHVLFVCVCVYQSGVCLSVGNISPCLYLFIFLA